MLIPRRVALLLALLALPATGMSEAPSSVGAPAAQESGTEPQAPPVLIPEMERVQPTPAPSITDGLPETDEAPRPAAEKAQQEPPAEEPVVTLQRNEFQDFIAQSTGQSLPLFGYDLFSNVPSTFAPIDQVPVTPDYVVGPGDELIIRTWGQVDINLHMTVDRNGNIFIPKAGDISVAGIRYNELQGYLKTAIGRVFRNFEINVTLGNLRSIQVIVVGQASRPGNYTVSSLSTLINALFASGGPSSKGSMRHIQLKRGKLLVTELDLYDLLIKGDKSRDVQLLPGDVIYIPPIGQLVAITGSVNVPAIYELKGPTTLENLLQLAGGLTTTAAGQKVTVERIVERKVRKVAEFPLVADGLSRRLQDGDLVQVFALSPRFDNAVTLRGHVAAPMRYPWHEGMRIRDLIPEKAALIVSDYWVKKNAAAKAGGTTGEGLRGELKQGALDINWDYAAIERMQPDNLSTTLIPFNLGKAVLENDPANNLPLYPGDVVTVFSQADMQVPVARQSLFVRVEGEINHAGVYKVQPGETLRQLVARVGGLTPDAYLFGAEFTRESTRVLQQKKINEAVDRLEREVEQKASFRAQGALAPEDVSAAQVQLDSQRTLVARLRQVKATGRIVLEISPDETRMRDLPDLVLEDGDRFLVPARHSTVSVIGSVYNENAFIYKTGKRISDYLSLAGGVTKDADAGSIYVIRADGSVMSKSQSNWVSGFAGDRLMPGDTVVVPTDLAKVSWAKQLKDWTQILYQFGLGAAAVKVLQ